MSRKSRERMVQGRFEGRTNEEPVSPGLSRRSGASRREPATEARPDWQDDDQTPAPYPSQIVVFCDRCGTEVEHDYMVHDQMTREQRLGVARSHLASNEGWSCTAEGDFCPACKLATTTNEAPGR